MADKKRILIVDDSAIMRLKLREIFENNNYEVVGEAENGNQAIPFFKELKPDLVTCDIVMPGGMDGIALLRILMTMNKEANVVMVSSVGTKDDVLQTLKLGAKNYITKPYDEQMILSVVKEILKD